MYSVVFSTAHDNLRLATLDLPLQKFHQNPFITFSRYLAHGQTRKRTGSRNISSLAEAIKELRKKTDDNSITRKQFSITTTLSTAFLAVKTKSIHDDLESVAFASLLPSTSHTRSRSSRCPGSLELPARSVPGIWNKLSAVPCL